MKNNSVSSVFSCLILITITVLFMNIDLAGQTTPVPDTGNKQYVQVNLKNGEVLILEYQSFIQANLDLVPDKISDTATPMGQTKSFGEKRILFKEKDSCREHSISLDNLQEMEFIGIVENKCTQKKDRLFKIYLLDLDKYEGFLQPVASDINKPMDQQALKGQVLNTADTKTFRYEDIEKITFFAR